MKKLRIHRDDFLKIRNLFMKEKAEQFLFLLAEKVAVNSSRIIYLVKELIFPESGDMKIQSSALVEPNFDFQFRVYQKAKEKKLALFDLHNHWFQRDPRFSGIDLDYASQNARFLERFSPGIDFGLAVFNDKVDAFSGLVFNKKSKAFDQLDAIEIIGSPMELLSNGKLKEQARADEKYSRHSLIPGWQQNILPDLKIAVIGAGGTGSHIIQALASMGVGEGKGALILVDPDRIEKSNLSRIPYATENDIGKFKVKVASQYIRSKNPRIKVVAIPRPAQSEIVKRFLGQAHLVFGAVDSEGARKVISQLAESACIPYIDIGTEIIPEANSYYAGGQVRVVMPRQGCLLCINGIDLSEAALDLVSEEKARDYEKAGYIRGTGQSPTPSVIHLNGVVSYLAVSQFIKFIFGENMKSQRAVFYNQQKMILLAADFDPNPSCALCGTQTYKEGKNERVTGTKAQYEEGLHILSPGHCPDPAPVLSPLKSDQQPYASDDEPAKYGG